MQMSISFTIGKASVPKKVNIAHNNREFIAPNIDGSRTCQNVTYVREDIRESYTKLFGNALAKYNAQQKRADRVIHDYYEHIQKSKREETCYEAIIQFGDRNNAGCGTAGGAVAQKMLDEYMKSFQQRNPNLYVFNAVLHLDEDSPHLHIDFIPFYTHGRTKGLEVGVSMRSAMDEMGFKNKCKAHNSLVAWEESERREMERILNRHGIQREDKHDHHKHMDVEPFKASKDAERAVQEALKAAPLSLEEQQAIRQKVLIQKAKEAEFIRQDAQSEYRGFYYASEEKRAAVTAELDKRHIPYRDTSTGFEAQACFVDVIRDIEEKIKTENPNYRQQLRDEVDRRMMDCNSMEDLLGYLTMDGYEVKIGKYISVKPPDSQKFIRLKSLGAEYTESGLMLRIKNRMAFEKQLESTTLRAERDHKSEEVIITLKTMILYTIAFKKGDLPVHRKNPQKALSWVNDAELDALLALNNRFNEGATLETLHQEFAAAEQKKDAAQKVLQRERQNLTGYRKLREKLLLYFEGQPSSRFTIEDAKRTLTVDYPMVNRENYQQVHTLVAQQEETLKQAEIAMQDAEDQLKLAAGVFEKAERVLAGTYVEELVKQEEYRRASKFGGNGMFGSNGEEFRTWNLPPQD